MDLKEQAKALAQRQFKGRTDKAGVDYFTGHLLAVASLVHTDQEKAVAYLHDILEDTDYPEEELRRQFGDEITDAVVLLTHKERLDEEGYLNYIRSLAGSGNRLAVSVKKADLTNNSDYTRLGAASPDELPEKDRRRWLKYQKALKILNNEKPQADRAYQLMFDVAAERIRKHDPEEIAANTGAVYDREKGVLRLHSMGSDFEIALPSCETHPQPENWHSLVMLHYLDLADGTPVTGERISFRDVKDGLIRGDKFEFTAARTFERILRGKDEEELTGLAENALGAMKTEGKGDLNFTVPFFPNFPIYLNIWFADEDFPAAGRMFADTSAEHYLTIEDIVTVGEIIFNRLEKAAAQ